MPVERLGRPRVGPVAGRLRPSLMSMIRLRRTAREIVRRVPGLLRRGAWGPPSPVHGCQPAPDRGVRAEGIHAISLNGLPALRRRAATHFLAAFPSVFFPARRASPPAPAPGGKPSPAETEPLRPVPCPGAPAGHPAPRVAGPRQFFLAAISLERRDAKAAAETRKRAGGLLPAAPARAQEARQFSPM